MRILLGILPCAFWILSAALARADVPNLVVRLEYTRGIGAERCPDEDDVRDFLTGEFTYDPVRPEASTTVGMSITRVSGQLQADLYLKDAQGNILWEEHVEGGGDCAILVRRLALKAYIQTIVAVSPAPAPPDPPAPVAPPAFAPPIHAQPVPAPHPPARRSTVSSVTPGARHHPVRIHLGLNGLVNVGITPTVSVGPSVTAGARWWRLGLELDARAAWSVVPYLHPGTRIDDAKVASIGSRLIGATIAPCYYHERFFFACAVFNIELLDLIGDSETSGEAHAQTVWGIGPRTGFEWPIAGRLYFRGTLEISATVQGAGIQLHRTQDWQVAPVFGTLGAGIIAVF